MNLNSYSVQTKKENYFTKTLPFAASFSGFSDPIPWLIALTFFFAKGFIKIGLENRVTYQFIKLFCSSSLGLGYSLVFSEALLAPMIPSVSERVGGIFLPLVKVLCMVYESNAADGTKHRLGNVHDELTEVTIG
ncbi:hypothetical protein JHK82_043567 [Glycine max]|nr:hypothetical protein JHK82_043567 [Glycine max]